MTGWTIFWLVALVVTLVRFHWTLRPEWLERHPYASDLPAGMGYAALCTIEFAAAVNTVWPLT